MGPWAAVGAELGEIVRDAEQGELRAAERARAASQLVVSG